MKCVIEGRGVRVFGKAVHALSRIGDEMWLDPQEKGLAVRSVNAAQSAYGCFLFAPLFFQQYLPHPDLLLKCKLNMKCVLPLFRCVAWREHSVVRCELSINTPHPRVMFQFHCRHGITKTFNLGYEECEALQAVFQSHVCPNVLKAPAKLLGDVVVHFPLSQEEVTLSLSSLKVTLKSFCEEQPCVKGLNTEMALHPQEFDYLQVGVESSVTFCLKELRGLLSFAESYGLQVSAHFGEAGQPVCFSVEDMMVEARVVLSTLTDAESQPLLAARNDGHVSPLRASRSEPEVNLVPSSQGSEIFDPVLHMRKMVCLQMSEEMPEAGLTTPITPATFKVRSLLFGAVLTNGTGGKASTLASLACASDTDEDGGTEEDVMQVTSARREGHDLQSSEEREA